MHEQQLVQPHRVTDRCVWEAARVPTPAAAAGVTPSLGATHGVASGTVSSGPASCHSTSRACSHRRHSSGSCRRPYPVAASMAAHQVSMAALSVRECATKRQLSAAAESVPDSVYVRTYLNKYAQLAAAAAAAASLARLYAHSSAAKASSACGCCALSGCSRSASAR
eukprot:scaffold49522_cov54-Phaeocystis_antarctica.AAC.4